MKTMKLLPTDCPDHAFEFAPGVVHGQGSSLFGVALRRGLLYRLGRRMLPYVTTLFFSLPLILVCLLYYNLKTVPIPISTTASQHDVL